MFDEHSNFGISNVVSPPSPNISGNRLSVTSGDGANFPTPPFNATVWQANTLPKSTNAEIVRVTAKSGDVFTISRTQENSTARSIVTGDQIAATITKKTLTDIEDNVGSNDIFVTVGSSGADYTTNGVADDVQINAAILAVNSAGGGIVHIKAGTYNIAATIRPKSNVVLSGEGSSATIIKLANSTSVHMFTVSNVQNAGFYKFQVDGNKANNVTGTHLFRLDTTCSSIVFEDLYIHDSPQHGIICDFSTGPHTRISINRVRAYNNGLSASGSGFYMLYCVDLKMSNITSTDNILDGIQWGDLAGPADEIQLNNINVHSNGRYGIYAPSGYANINNLTSYSNQIGVLVELGAKINLHNFNIYTNTGDGIRITSSNSSTIGSGNSYNNGTGGGSQAGLRLRATNVSETCNRHRIIGAAFFDTQGSPTQKYGILANGSGTVDSNVVIGNEMYGNITASFQQDTWGVNNIYSTAYNIVA